MPPFSEISDIAGVSDKTIKEAFQDMYPKILDLFPPDFVFVTPVDEIPFPVTCWYHHLICCFVGHVKSPP